MGWGPPPPPPPVEAPTLAPQMQPGARPPTTPALTGRTHLHAPAAGGVGDGHAKGGMIKSWRPGSQGAAWFLHNDAPRPPASGTATAAAVSCKRGTQLLAPPRPASAPDGHDTAGVNAHACDGRPGPQARRPASRMTRSRSAGLCAPPATHQSLNSSVLNRGLSVSGSDGGPPPASIPPSPQEACSDAMAASALQARCWATWWRPGSAGGAGEAWTGISVS